MTDVEVHFPSLAGVVERIGISYRQADYWVRMRYISVCDVLGRPTDGLGSGRHRYLLHAEAVVLERMARLVQAGLTPSVAAEAARDALPGEPHRIGDGVYVVLDPRLNALSNLS